MTDTFALIVVLKLAQLFKLGHGVDASDPSHPKTPDAIRFILPGSPNIQVAEVRMGRRKYTREISSIKSVSANIKASVNTPTTVPVKISAEGQACRSMETENRISGMYTLKILYTNLLAIAFTLGDMKITRTIEFKSFGSDCYHLPTSQQIEDTRFDANFCKYLVEKIPETGSCRGKTDEEKIDNFLSDGDSKKSDRAVDAAFNFLFTKGYITTHYISAIHLGACKYTRSSTNKTVTSGGGSIDALVLDSGVSVGGKASTTKISSTSSEVSKGDVDAVAIGQDEHLIEYELTPVSELLSLKRVKDVIKEAIVLHMERASKSRCSEESPTTGT